MANVSVGKPKVGGAIYVAPVGSTLPTDTTTALDDAFTSLGYVSEDGLTNSNSPETDDITAWGGDKVLTTQTSKEDTFGFTLIECLNADVLKTVYGSSNVTGTLATGLTVTAKTDELTSYAWVVEMVVGKTGVKRIVIPSAAITEIGEISYTDSDAVGYELTISADAISGVTHYEYILKA